MSLLNDSKILNKTNFENIKKIYNSKNYAFFEKGNYNLNIFGIRNSNHKADQFDDVLGVVYIIDGKNYTHLWPATTDPGATELTNPSFPNAIAKGVAIMAEGQYRGAYQLGFHGSGTWRHEALVQIKPVRIYRDSNRNTILDFLPKTLESGLYGINIHGSSLWGVAQNVGRASAGCQVFQAGKDLREFIAICKKASAVWGNSFTYTLFNQSDFN
jgi:hypothetical protein